MSGNETAKAIKEEKTIKTDEASALANLTQKLADMGIPADKLKTLKDNLDKEIKSTQDKAALPPEPAKPAKKQGFFDKLKPHDDNLKTSQFAQDIIDDLTAARRAGKDLATLAAPIAEAVKGQLTEAQVTTVLQTMNNDLPHPGVVRIPNLIELAKMGADEKKAEGQLKDALTKAVDNAVIVAPLVTPQKDSLPNAKDTLPKGKGKS